MSATLSSDEEPAIRPLSPIMCSQLEVEVVQQQQQQQQQRCKLPPEVVPRSSNGRAVRALYVTGNEGKFQEAVHIAEQVCGDKLKLERVKLDLAELQGSDTEIAVGKSKEAAKQLAGRLLHSAEGRGIRYLITDDSGLGLSCLNGFPGVYIKPMLERLQVRRSII